MTIANTMVAGTAAARVYRYRDPATPIAMIAANVAIQLGFGLERVVRQVWKTR